MKPIDQELIQRYEEELQKDSTREEFQVSNRKPNKQTKNEYPDLNFVYQK